VSLKETWVLTILRTCRFPMLKEFQPKMTDAATGACTWALGN